MEVDTIKMTVTSDIEINIARGYSLPDDYVEQIDAFRELQKNQMGDFINSLVKSDDADDDAYARAMKVL